MCQAPKFLMKVLIGSELNQGITITFFSLPDVSLLRDHEPHKCQVIIFIQALVLQSSFFGPLERFGLIGQFSKFLLNL